VVRGPRSAFTLIEIAICLAVIGFALVAIIGIMPMGMQVQKDNRQETMINLDANIFLEAIRSGGRNMDDLTHYVVEIRNTYTNFGFDSQTVSYTATTGPGGFTINSGNRIIGLLSTPKICPSPDHPGTLRSNYFVAFVRSMSGAASEKFPQSNPDVSTFSYRMNVDIVPYSDYPPDWQTTAPEVVKVVETNLYDVRLTFRWPVDVNWNWKQGGSRQVVRFLAAGSMMTTNDNGTINPNTPVGATNYFLQSRSYVKP